MGVALSYFDLRWMLMVINFAYDVGQMIKSSLWRSDSGLI